MTLSTHADYPASSDRLSVLHSIAKLCTTLNLVAILSSQRLIYVHKFTDYDSSTPTHYHSARHIWYEFLQQAKSACGTPLIDPPKVFTELIAGGFDLVSHAVVKLACNGWPETKHEKDVGRWFHLVVNQYIDSWSRVPLAKWLAWEESAIDELLKKVEAELCSRKVQMWNNL